MNEGHLGFSGTQRGMTARQAEEFVSYLMRVHPNHFHHGCCIGSDFQAHILVRKWLPGCVIIGHPPINSYKMYDVRLAPCDVMRLARPYMERNQEIVDESERFVATPKENSEVLRSGTWSTIRRARMAHGYGKLISATVIAP